MNLADLSQMSISNLFRTKLRTILTTSGVIVGIGALVSMVSFGTGMQKNVSDAMQMMEVFTFMEVMPQKFKVAEKDSILKHESKPSSVLNDSVITWITSLPGVKVAYPEITIPARLRYGQQTRSATIRAVPMIMKNFAPFKKMGWGKFFSSDTARELVASNNFLRRLKINEPDSVIGKELDVITAKLEISKFNNLFDAIGLISNGAQLFSEEVNKMKLVGVWDDPEFGTHRMANAIMPMGTSKTIAHLDFSSVWDLLQDFGAKAGYPMVYVRLAHMRHMQEVADKIEEQGFRVWTIAGQLQEMRTGFLIFDAALGAVGTIALFVALLGIINTMVMSVLERYREIGIMKAIGATDWDVKNLFFFESSIIGLMGGSLGIVLGWIVTRVANAIANVYIAKQGGPHMELFYIPWWLILGGIAFAVIVSLLAGLYPSSRAARVDPVTALRHD